MTGALIVFLAFLILAPVEVWAVRRRPERWGRIAVSRLAPPFELTRPELSERGAVVDYRDPAPAEPLPLLPLLPPGSVKRGHDELVPIDDGQRALLIVGGPKRIPALVRISVRPGKRPDAIAFEARLALAPYSYVIAIALMIIHLVLRGAAIAGAAVLVALVVHRIVLHRRVQRKLPWAFEVLAERQLRR